MIYERHQQILDIVNERGSVTVDFLCQKLFTSGATIRRYLSQMDDQGIIQRVRGGAVSLKHRNKDTPLVLRQNNSLEKKRYIAQLATKYVKDSSVLFMDSSSTVTALAENLSRFRNLTIITNGITTMYTLNEKTSFKLIFCGGLVLEHSATVGFLAVDTVKSFQADVLFFSCSALSINSGPTEANEECAVVEKAMWANANKRILLCDSTKFDSDCFCKVCNMCEIDLIITDKKPENHEYIDLLGPKLIYE